MKFQNVGGVAEMFTDPGRSGYIIKHIKQSDLEEIISTSSMNKKMDILNNILERENFPESFTSDLYKQQKEHFLKRLDDLLPGAKKLRTEEELGFKKRKKKEKAIKYTVQQKRVKQKSVRGKEYKRGYDRWSIKEEYIIKSYKNKSDKEIQKKISEQTGRKRSIYSIKRKRSRL